MSKLKKYAIMIGISYRGTSAALSGCIEDIINIQELLSSKLNYSKFMILSDSNKRAHRKHIKPTKRNILKALDKAVKLSNNGYNEIFIHYSGHGTYVKDRNGDEKDKYDEAIVPSDFHKNLITDDEIFKKISQVKSTCNLILVFDCCHSGSIADLPYTVKNKTVKQENSHKLQSNISMFSGCLDKEKSFSIHDKKTSTWAGALSTSFAKWVSIYVEDKKKLTCFKLLDLMNNDMDKKKYAQNPQYSSSKLPNKKDVFIGEKGIIQIESEKSEAETVKKTVKKKTKKKSNTTRRDRKKREARKRREARKKKREARRK